MKEGSSLPLLGRRRSRVTVTDSCVEALLTSISEGIYRAGSKLPSEEALAAQLEVSRATVRDALQRLQERGVVRRVHGRGTFVAERSIRKELNHNYGISQMIRMAGYTPATGSQRIERIAASSTIAEKLLLEVRAPVVRLERLRLADGRPVVLATDILSTEILDEPDLKMLNEEHTSVYMLLHQHRGIEIQRAEADIVPERATVELAAQLDVRRGAPLLCIEQVDFDGDGRPVIYSIEHHLSDWVRFTVERRGPGGSIDVHS